MKEQLTKQLINSWKCIASKQLINSWKIYVCADVICANRAHGFRSGCSCESQLVVTAHNLLSYYDQNRQVDPIALRKGKIVYNFDLSKCIRVK